MRLTRLDGVRSLAILAVIIYHHYFLYEIGWAGVDLFFVLSGFLITRILRSSAEKKTYWSRFYLKRAVRILPPLLLLFVLALVLSRHISPVSFAGYALFLGNVMNLTHYQVGLFLVLWSLAVEEHFYLLWPLAVRLLTRQRLLALLAAVLLLEPILRAVVTPHTHSYEPIFFTPFRLDSIAAGSLLALLTEDTAASRWLSRWSLPGTVASVALYLAIRLSDPQFLRESNSVLFNSLGYTLIAAVCFFFVAWVLLHPGGVADKVLSWTPLVYIGRISFGMYLLHPVVLTILKKVRHVPFGAAGAAGTHHLLVLTLPLTIALAALSFQFYETPLLNWGSRRAARLEGAAHEPSRSEQAAVSDPPQPV